MIVQVQETKLRLKLTLKSLLPTLDQSRYFFDGVLEGLDALDFMEIMFRISLIIEL